MKKLFLFLVFFMISILSFSQIIDNSNDVVTVPIQNNYLDIISVDISLKNKLYQVTLIMNGNIPMSTEMDWEFIEWDLMIDKDQNPETRTWGPYLNTTNDIGVDYMIRLTLKYNNMKAEIWRNKGNDTTSIKYKIDNNKIILYFKQFQIQNTDQFDYTILVRKYVGNGRPDSLVYYDKLPENGHLTFSKNGENDKIGLLNK